MKKWVQTIFVHFVGLEKVALVDPNPIFPTPEHIEVNL